MSLPAVVLKAGAEKRLESGHLWVFSNEVASVSPGLEPGGLADIASARKQFLGRGYYNPHSLIAARILTPRNEPVDAAFFTARLKSALELRKALYPDDSSYRLAFGESDFLPGLVVDRLKDVFVLQSYALGMDRLLPLVAEAIETLFPGVMIVKKSESGLRELEGLKDDVGVLRGQAEVPVRIKQRFGTMDVFFLADPMQGQKTGFFFDQRENRERLWHYARGKTVLDAFCYTGAFGIYALKSGAKQVVFVDSSEYACQGVEKNLELNGLKAEVLNADVSEALGRFLTQKRKFDIIVLDPPALAKSKKVLFGALRKYKKLNELALQALHPGGLLVSCSCSHHVSRGEVLKMLNAAAQDRGRTLQVLEARGAARDHPVHPGMPETEYLKCVIAKVNPRV